jgi:hypothetical protein
MFYTRSYNTMKAFLFILVLATLPSLSSCQLFGNEPELPPITTEGKGTFGCLVNGELLLNDAPWGYGTGAYVELQKIADTVGVNIYAGSSSQRKNLIISVWDSPTLQVGKIYNLKDFDAIYTDYSSTISCQYRTVISGSIKFLKVNTTTPIVAGIFEFTASSIDCQDKVTITSGRFDINQFL